MRSPRTVTAPWTAVTTQGVNSRVQVSRRSTSQLTCPVESQAPSELGRGGWLRPTSATMVSATGSPSAAAVASATRPGQSAEYRTLREPITVACAA